MNLEQRREYNRKWYQKHRETEIQGSLEYLKEHPEKKKEYSKRHRLKVRKDPQKLERLREYFREYAKIWRKKNPEKKKESDRKSRIKRREKNKILYQIWVKNNPEKMKINQRRAYIKRKNNPKCRVDDSMRILIWRALKGKKAGRKWEILVGYTIEDLAKHLESQFDDKMTWDNYGNYWEIDHIKARSLFYYESPEDLDFQKCWALENLQPLEKIANRQKGNR